MRKTITLLFCVPVLFAACACGAKAAPPVTETIAPTVEVELSIEEPCAVDESAAEEAAGASRPTISAVSEEVPVQLSDDRAYACDPTASGRKRPRVAEPAIDFMLKDVEGNSYTLSELLTEKPVYLAFGSFT